MRWRGEQRKEDYDLRRSLPSNFQRNALIFVSCRLLAKLFLRIYLITMTLHYANERWLSSVCKQAQIVVP